MADRRSVGGKRLDGLIDSAFAFAATLLVVGKSGTMQSYSDLLDNFANVPAFALSLTLIVSFWWAHRQFALLVERYDAISETISLLIMFIILIFVFPLSFLSEALVHWLSDGRLPGRGLTADETRTTYIIFGIGFCFLSGLYSALFGLALRTKGFARVSKLLRPRVRAAALTWLWCMVAGFLSLAIAIWGDINNLIWKPVIPYLLLFIYVAQHSAQNVIPALRRKRHMHP